MLFEYSTTITKRSMSLVKLQMTAAGDQLAGSRVATVEGGICL